MMELLGGLDRQRFRPVFFAPVEREWHADLRAVDVEVVTLTAVRVTVPAVAPGRTSPDGVEHPPRRKDGACGGTLLDQAADVDRHRSWLPTGLAWSAGLLLELRQLVK